MIKCLSFFLVPSWSSSTPFYPQSVVSQGACLDSLPFRRFHFRFTFEFIKELGGASHNYPKFFFSLQMPRLTWARLVNNIS
jgi:hypothetical protein